MRGLPYSASVPDITHFFDESKITPGVCVCAAAAAALAPGIRCFAPRYPPTPPPRRPIAPSPTPPSPCGSAQTIPGGVYVVSAQDGRATGEAFVEFETDDDAQKVACSVWRVVRVFCFPAGSKFSKIYRRSLLCICEYFPSRLYIHNRAYSRFVYLKFVIF